MTTEHSSSAGHVHDASCAKKRHWWTNTFNVATAPLRWLIVGCVGLAVVGMVLPFSPIPPCPMLTITGVPCPLCGMTRSARSFFRFDFSAALRYQPFGLALCFGGAVILAMWAFPKTRAVNSIRVPVALIVALFVASWIWNIGFNPTFT